MTIEQLRHEANSLPYSPGVYIMRDKENHVIYVGKAKKLKNRVSQYFQENSGHNLKTQRMISKVDHFEVIIAASEFEALVLECSLIKRYLPRYNILLKDDKGYPFVRLHTSEPYARITVVNQIENDGAEYFGPFGSRGVTNDLVQTIIHALKLPDCNRRFPRDIGKDRPCLNYHMNLCAGWCRGDYTEHDYQNLISQAKRLLSGDYRAVSASIKNKMLDAAQKMKFELAASLRDQLNAVEALGKKQLVTAGGKVDVDVIGYAQTEVVACFAVLHFSSGTLIDKDFELFQVPDDAETAVSSLLKQYYLLRNFAPRKVLLPFQIGDAELYSQLLLQKYGRKTVFHVPQRGNNAKLINLANSNANEEACRVTEKEARTNAVLLSFGKMLGLPVPERIESFDISNISGTDIVAGMVVFQDGKPKRSAYRHFKIEDLTDQDDYASMRQVLIRRFKRFLKADPGFDILPDVLLIDGGIAHAKIAVDVLTEVQLKVPVFGMVKDDRHRTRALVTPDGKEIKIDHLPSIFSFVGNIQEETHRFAIQFHKKLRSKRLRYSELDGIPGIGDKRKQDLLKIFKSLRGIASAELSELERYLPKNAARAVYDHFKQKGEEICE